MTPEEEARALAKRTVDHSEARQIAQRLINSHFGNDDRARMSIPTRPDHDDDCLIMAYIEQQERNAVALAERVEALTVDLREACDMADENAQAATRAEAERERYRRALKDAETALCVAGNHLINCTGETEAVIANSRALEKVRAALTPTQEEQRGE